MKKYIPMLLLLIASLVLIMVGTALVEATTSKEVWSDVLIILSGFFLGLFTAEYRRLNPGMFQIRKKEEKK